MLQDPDQSEAFDNWPIRFILILLKNLNIISKKLFPSHLTFI